MNVFDEVEDNSEWLSKKAVVAYLFAAYFVFVLVRFFVAMLFTEPVVFGDELSYRYLAYSFYKFGDPFVVKNFGHVEQLNNILYALLISPAFYFGDNFYIAGKFINCLLINSVIFPSYYIMRQFVSSKKAFFTALIILFMPFFNIANYMMTENLYFPLFLWCFFAAYRYLVTHTLRMLLVAMLLLLLLFFTKPTAIMLAIAFAATIVILPFVTQRTYQQRKKHVIYAGIILFFAVIIAYLSKEQLKIYDMLFGSYSASTWHLVTEWSDFAILSESLVSMLMSHVVSFLLVYLLPTLVATFALKKYIVQKNDNNSIFIVFVLVTFLCYFLATIKFSLYTAAIEPFSRLHARYYFMTYPLFIYVIVAFGPSIVWNKLTKTKLAGFYVLLVFLAAIYFYPNFIEKKSYGFVVDNIDLSGLLLMPYLYVLVSLSFISAIIIYYAWKPKQFILLPFISLFLGMSLLQNMAYVYTLQSLRLQDTATIFSRISRNLVYKNIPGFDKKVLMIGSSPLPVLNTSFWLSYDYTAVRILKKNEEINLQNIPQDTEFIVLYDDYRVNIPLIKVAERVNGTYKCIILKTHKHV